MDKINVVALIIYKDGKVLMERRKSSEPDDPGKVFPPSGHVEKGETMEETCKRELKEEIDLDCDNFKFITKLPNSTKTEKQMLYFYSCEGWKGEPKSLDAAEVFWIGQDQLEIIDCEADITAIKKFFKTKS